MNCKLVQRLSEQLRKYCIRGKFQYERSVEEGIELRKPCGNTRYMKMKLACVEMLNLDEITDKNI